MNVKLYIYSEYIRFANVKITGVGKRFCSVNDSEYVSVMDKVYWQITRNKEEITTVFKLIWTNEETESKLI